MVDFYFKLKVMEQFIGYALFMLILLVIFGLWAYILVSDWLDDRKRKKRKGAGK